VTQYVNQEDFDRMVLALRTRRARLLEEPPPDYSPECASRLNGRQGVYEYIAGVSA
jgi:hypothetical protein